MPPRAGLVFHINLSDLSAWRRARRLTFFQRLAEICEAQGLSYEVRQREASLMRPHRAVPDGKLHIVEDGAAEGEGWLNAALAYLLGFWHLDPQGILADSAARHARFAPRQVDQTEAQVFFRKLRRRFVTPRLTRYNPTSARAADLPVGAIAVFLQGKTPCRNGQCQVDMHEIILAACKGAGPRPVVVKPHPLSLHDCALAISRAAELGARFQLFDGNIHDLLATCAVTVSANSAAAIEGFLHRKPAILFGRSDFESLVTRAHAPEEFPAALEAALAANWRYPKMLQWYFTRHTLEVAAPEFEDRVFAAFASVGYTRDRLGLSD